MVPGENTVNSLLNLEVYKALKCLGPTFPEHQMGLLKAVIAPVRIFHVHGFLALPTCDAFVVVCCARSEKSEP